MATCLLALCLAGPAAAQGLPSEKKLTAETLLDAIAGHTVGMFDADTGALVGYERFVSRERSRWRRADGTCAIGAVTVAGGAICFRYDDAPGEKYCWHPLYSGGEPAYRLIGTGEVQVIRGADKDAAECTLTPTS